MIEAQVEGIVEVMLLEDDVAPMTAEAVTVPVVGGLQCGASLQVFEPVDEELAAAVAVSLSRHGLLLANITPHTRNLLPYRWPSQLKTASAIQGTFQDKTTMGRL